MIKKETRRKERRTNGSRENAKEKRAENRRKNERKKPGLFGSTLRPTWIIRWAYPETPAHRVNFIILLYYVRFAGSCDIVTREREREREKAELNKDLIQQKREQQRVINNCKFI